MDTNQEELLRKHYAQEIGEYNPADYIFSEEAIEKSRENIQNYQEKIKKITQVNQRDLEEDRMTI
jgi:hypothetical protein